MIREAKSPTLVREMLLAYLPEKHRHTEEMKGRKRRPYPLSAARLQA